MSYYKTPTGYFGVTDKSPKRFEGVVFIGRGGDSPETVTEQAVVPKPDWVEIDADDVPDDWFNTIGYEKRAIACEPEWQPGGEYQALGRLHQREKKCSDCDFWMLTALLAPIGYTIFHYFF